MYALYVSGAVNTQGFVWTLKKRKRRRIKYIYKFSFSRSSFVHSACPLRYMCAGLTTTYMNCFSYSLHASIDSLSVLY